MKMLSNFIVETIGGLLAFLKHSDRSCEQPGLVVTGDGFIIAWMYLS